MRVLLLVSFDAYMRVLRTPGLARLVVLALFARLPHATSGLVFSLHVVNAMGEDFLHAGIATGVMTVGMAFGAPWRGRIVDRKGLRRALAPSVAVCAVCWCLVAFANYWMLLVLCLIIGVFMVPVFPVVRQALAAMTPMKDRQTAFALDSVAAEFTFMAGPVIGAWLISAYSTVAALVVIGVATVGGGALLMWLNPPTRSTQLARPNTDSTSDAVAAPADATPTQSPQTDSLPAADPAFSADGASIDDSAVGAASAADVPDGDAPAIGDHAGIGDAARAVGDHAGKDDAWAAGDHAGIEDAWAAGDHAGIEDAWAAGDHAGIDDDAPVPGAAAIDSSASQPYAADAGRPAKDRGQLFSPALVAVVGATFAATFTFSGVDLGIVAALKEWDMGGSTGFAFAMWSAGSALGGLAYGAIRRNIHPLWVVVALSLMTAPIALATTLTWLVVLVFCSGLLCAPALASINGSISQIVDEDRLGEAMGWNGTAMMVGSSLGSPLCGAAINLWGAPGSFLISAILGLVIAGIGLIMYRRRPV